MTPDHLPPLLLEALRAAPRPYRMPPLPADVPAAREAGVDAALAFALEQARLAADAGTAAPQAVRELFLWALAEVIRTALRAEGGDPSFQAQALRARTPDVETYAALQAQAKADTRAVRAAVSAIAHPARLERLPPSAAREALGPLHGLVQAGDWAALDHAAQWLAQHPPAGAARPDSPDALDARDAPDLAAAFLALAALPALQRLRQGVALLALDSVQRYRALCGQRGPQAGSQAAAATGRAAARLGAAAEDATVQAFGEVAALLNRQPGEAGAYSVAQGLHTPASLAGDVQGAKDEWDVALLRAAPGADALDVVLLAEVKACAAAATTDLPRLRRGLRRLALAAEDQRHAFFAGAAGEVWLSGRSLRQLQPPPAGLPPRALYCCTAPAETAPRWLDAAAKAVLLAEPASLRFAAALSSGAQAHEQALAPAWEALFTVPRLRTALAQYGLARDAREAMLHPRDLLAAVAERA